jgi:hypothetical protein
MGVKCDQKSDVFDLTVRFYRIHPTAKRNNEIHRNQPYVLYIVIILSTLTVYRLSPFTVPSSKL